MTLLSRIFAATSWRSSGGSSVRRRVQVGVDAAARVEESRAAPRPGPRRAGRGAPPAPRSACPAGSAPPPRSPARSPRASAGRRRSARSSSGTCRSRRRAGGSCRRGPPTVSTDGADAGGMHGVPGLVARGCPRRRTTRSPARVARLGGLREAVLEVARLVVAAAAHVHDADAVALAVADHPLEPAADVVVLDAPGGAAPSPGRRRASEASPR